MQNITPTTHAGFERYWRLNFQAETDIFLRHERSYLQGLIPSMAMTLTTYQVLDIYRKQLGDTFLTAIQPDRTIPSPLRRQTSPDWIKQTNMVGINVRTIGSFWNIMKYMLTIPAAQQSVHILPIWEPGVVASLYGMSSWNINPEFFDNSLAQLIPNLNTVEKQLKVVLNLLHATGRIVGMDVIPHTDRYSEIVLANPQYFEWLRRNGLDIVDHRADLHEVVQTEILQFLAQNGSATDQNFPTEPKLFFSRDFPEYLRLQVLFGDKEDYGGRLQRRDQLITHLYNLGYEPVPATMAPPYRGLEVDPNPDSKTIDEAGRVWRDYRITKPENMSRVFGPLTRYKLYKRLDDNRDWTIDFEQPRTEVWQYVCEKYADIQRTYNFDFMRGDMSHVQMRAEGVLKNVDNFYDIHKAIKAHIRQFVPYFSYFAETFLAPDNEMGYGNEVDHLLQSDAGSTLGDLQSMVVGSDRFLSEFARYRNILETTDLAPNFTIMTADKDDPRFDEFYLKGNAVRLFCGLFLTDMPSYMGLGFELRDPHPEPVANEFYTKLFVFKISEGAKAIKGDYRWGQNGQLFGQIARLREFSASILPEIYGEEVIWLKAPNGVSKVIVWQVKQYIFAANFDLEEAQSLDEEKNWEILFSTEGEDIDGFGELSAGEGRAYDSVASQ
ncbi:MAG: hypothetical protein AAGI23_02760 [Bacteroidota bacterium]